MSGCFQLVAAVVSPQNGPYGPYESLPRPMHGHPPSAFSALSESIFANLQNPWPTPSTELSRENTVHGFSVPLPVWVQSVSNLDPVYWIR